MEKILVMTVVMGLLLATKNVSATGFSITSPAFQNNQRIPAQYTCDGKNFNPPLKFENIPVETKSLALIVDDPDAPRGTWVHWVLYNILPSVREITEKSDPGMQGYNDFEQMDYGGPCPPSGTHRYFFKIYALDNRLDFPNEEASAITKARVEKAMQGHILAQAQIIGLYSRNK